MTSAASTKVPPQPPSDSGRRMPSHPSSPIFFQRSFEYPTASGLMARRRVTGDSLRTNAVAVSTSSFWSWERSKFMGSPSARRQPENQLGDDVLLDLVGSAINGRGTGVVEGRGNPLL